MTTHSNRNSIGRIPSSSIDDRVIAVVTEPSGSRTDQLEMESLAIAY